MNEELTKKYAPGHTSCAGCGIPAQLVGGRTVFGGLVRESGRVEIPLEFSRHLPRFAI